uniref:Uncharacterized protein n=1 Tax=Nelumbo nucifera TaxID=4432 RepID=A0A822ZG36_NELNU|nr:TPA_asm: hypothetical protein HUJ06_002322 [Nelumbo nucifera]
MNQILEHKQAYKPHKLMYDRINPDAKMEEDTRMLAPGHSTHSTTATVLYKNMLRVRFPSTTIKMSSRPSAEPSNLIFL